MSIVAVMIWSTILCFQAGGVHADGTTKCEGRHERSRSVMHCQYEALALRS